MSRLLDRLLAAYTPLAARHLLVDGQPHSAPRHPAEIPCSAKPAAAPPCIEIPCVRGVRATGEHPGSLAA
jgi:hypothetical protein